MASIKRKIIGLVLPDSRIQFFLQGTYSALVGKASRPLVNAVLAQLEAVLLGGNISDSVNGAVRVFSVLLDHLVRPVQHRLWNREAERFRRLEINHELKLGWLFNRQVGGLGSLQDSVHVVCDAPVDIRKVRSVVHEPAGLHRSYLAI